MTRLPAVIAVQLRRLPAVHRNVADLTAPAANCLVNPPRRIRLALAVILTVAISLSRAVSSPVAFDLITVLLEVSEAATGVALLLVGVVAVPGHVSGLPTVVAQLFSLLFGLLAVPGDVTAPAAVVTGCRTTACTVF